MPWEKPSDEEEEYFHREDQEKIRKLREELDKKRQTQSMDQRKQAHWMKCPKCGSDLEEINYHNVMIDKCPECNGIWLDQGELELLAKAEPQATKGLLGRLFG